MNDKLHEAIAKIEKLGTQLQDPKHPDFDPVSGQRIMGCAVLVREALATQPTEARAHKWIREKAAQEDGALVSAGSPENYEQCPKCLHVFPCQHEAALLGKEKEL